jgi:hypothetical protein
MQRGTIPSDWTILNLNLAGAVPGASAWAFDGCILRVAQNFQGWNGFGYWEGLRRFRRGFPMPTLTPIFSFYAYHILVWSTRTLRRYRQLEH